MISMNKKINVLLSKKNCNGLGIFVFISEGVLCMTAIIVFLDEIHVKYVHPKVLLNVLLFLSVILSIS